MEECASTTNPQVGIKYERSIYVTSGRSSTAFQETSCSIVIQIGCRFRRKAVYISVFITGKINPRFWNWSDVKTIAAHAEGQFMTLDHWILILKEFWSLLCKDFTLQLIITSQKRSLYVWTYTLQHQLFFSSGPIPLLQGWVFVLRPALVLCPDAHSIWHRRLTDISFHRYYFCTKAIGSKLDLINTRWPLIDDTLPQE